MSASYTTEPPPTSTVLLHTTAGPLTLSLFANQTPLTTRNFLQHALDGTYDGTIFHRVAPSFVIQTGDPTGTGEGGENIYEDREFETYDAAWARLCGREKGEKIRFGDEIHSRLRFNRRGLVGMARSEGKEGGYGSQFFVTLGDCRAELDGRCTMFGRVEGEGIYNVVKIADGELVEGTERPVYPEKILSVEVVEMPRGEAWEGLRRREKVAQRVVEQVRKEKPKKKKAGKALLSFGGDDGDSEDVGVVVRPKKAKFNTALINGPVNDTAPNTNGASSKKHNSPPPARRKPRSPSPSIPAKRKASPTLSKTPSPTHHRTPSFHDSTTQLPLRNEEAPSNSPSPTPPPSHRTKAKTTATLESEIAALKQSMRRPDTISTNGTAKKKSALESLIPETSTRGRKRPRPGDTAGNTKSDASALKMLNAFRARLEKADKDTGSKQNSQSGATANGTSLLNPADADNRATAPDRTSTNNTANADAEDEDSEPPICDLHFIAHCQSCAKNDSLDLHPTHILTDETVLAPNEDDTSFLSHSLNFAKDRLGKDLSWRENMRNLKEEDLRELGVVDVKGKEREAREREREKKRMGAKWKQKA